MSNKEGLFKEAEAIGGVRRLAYARPSSAPGSGSRVQLASQCGVRFAFPLIPVFWLFLLHSLTVHATVTLIPQRCQRQVTVLTSTLKDPVTLHLE